MYAVVGVWKTDPGRADQQQDSLLNRIVPEFGNCLHW